MMKSDAERNLALRLGCGPVVVSKRSLGRLAGLTFDIVERERERGDEEGEGARGRSGSWWGVLERGGGWCECSVRCSCRPGEPE